MKANERYLEIIAELKHLGVEYVTADDPKVVKCAVEWGNEENHLTLEVAGSEGFSCYKVTYH